MINGYFNISTTTTAKIMDGDDDDDDVDRVQRTGIGRHRNERGKKANE